MKQIIASVFSSYYLILLEITFCILSYTIGNIIFLYWEYHFLYF